MITKEQFKKYLDRKERVRKYYATILNPVNKDAFKTYGKINEEILDCLNEEIGE